MADLVSLLQIKLCMVQLFGFQRCQMTSGRGTFRVIFDGLGQLSSSPVVQSCFQGLMRALDTSLPCDLPPACMVESNDDAVAQGLLGSIFVDVVIKTINQIDFLQTPYIVARCLLTSLVIILAKVSSLQIVHGFRSSTLRPPAHLFVSEMDISSYTSLIAPALFSMILRAPCYTIGSNLSSRQFIL
jgi:hypothetical protein